MSHAEWAICINNSFQSEAHWGRIWAVLLPSSIVPICKFYALVTIFKCIAVEDSPYPTYQFFMYGAESEYLFSNPVNRPSNDCSSEVSMTISRVPSWAKYSLIKPLKVVWAHWRMREIQTSYVALKWDSRQGEYKKKAFLPNYPVYINTFSESFTPLASTHYLRAFYRSENQKVTREKARCLLSYTIMSDLWNSNVSLDRPCIRIFFPHLWLFFYTKVENRQRRLKHGCAQSLTDQQQLGSILRCVLSPGAIGQGKIWSGSPLVNWSRQELKWVNVGEVGGRD